MNPEHLKIVSNWASLHAWRQEHRNARLDLSGSHLRDSGHLSHADLRGANLTAANLSNLKLSGTQMQKTNLRKASLFSVDLSGADLSRANLRQAHMESVNLSHADLRGANLERSIIAFGTFTNVDLSEVKGLESVFHQGASSIGTDTLFLSKGKIPEVFLRGCGLSDWEIEAAKLYDPKLSSNQIVDIQQRVFDLRAGYPIQIGSLFISYTHADSAFVDALEKKLNEKGIRFWRDVHQATAGRLDKVIDRAIRLNPTVLLVLSEHSLKSDWVEDEANRARELEKTLARDVLCPIALDDSWRDCGWSRPLRTQISKYTVLPFHDWKDPAALDGMFRRLVEGLSIFYHRSVRDR